jgi:hypothetical protein
MGLRGRKFKRQRQPPACSPFEAWHNNARPSTTKATTVISKSVTWMRPIFERSPAQNTLYHSHLSTSYSQLRDVYIQKMGGNKELWDIKTARLGRGYASEEKGGISVLPWPHPFDCSHLSFVRPAEQAHHSSPSSPSSPTRPYLLGQRPPTLPQTRQYPNLIAAHYLEAKESTRRI